MSLTLLDWRRRVAALYAAVRDEAAADPAGAADRFRTGRDALFADHPESPLPPAARAAFAGLPYWPYDPALRFEVDVQPAPARRLMAESIVDATFPLEVVGRVELPFGSLEVYWISVYGGGLFVPFRDATSGTSTYGAGRYLLDTIKGADLGGDGKRVVLDFNYAYHPSCAYDARWACPLAPPANWLAVPVEAGERL